MFIDKGDDAGGVDGPEQTSGWVSNSRVALARDHAGEMGNSQSAHKISAHDRYESTLQRTKLRG